MRSAKVVEAQLGIAERRSVLAEVAADVGVVTRPPKVQRLAARKCPKDQGIRRHLHKRQIHIVVEIENLGLCRPGVARDRAAFALYEYDTIIINPASYSHFLFGKATKFSNEEYELSGLKAHREDWDLDAAFDYADRAKEMEAALRDGADVVWCLSEARRQNFFGYRETSLGYVAPKVEALVKRANVQVKKSRRISGVDPDDPFARYFEALSKSGWEICLEDPDNEGLSSMASTPEGYSLGGRISLGETHGWLVTPPTSDESGNQVIQDAIRLRSAGAAKSKYHGLFLSHTGADKPFVRRLKADLLARGVEKVWVDEAEIDIGDSLTAKIDEGMKVCRYIGVVLSPRSINAPWVKKELDVAMNREIEGGQVVVLPLLYEKAELPAFLKGKLYADFTDPKTYEDVLEKLLRRLRV